MFQRLGPETWGQRLRRARNLSGISTRDAAAAIGTYMPISRQRLLDLEKLDAIPPTYMRRIAAYLTIVAYGIDPADFELDTSCLPTGWDVPKVVKEVRENALRLSSGAAISEPSSAWIRTRAA